MNYDNFIQSKTKYHEPSGFDVSDSDINDIAFPYQKHTIKKAIKYGKYDCFSGCGTGKTIIELEWGRLVEEYTDGKVLHIAPLAVKEQTIREAKKLGIENIDITNYEQLHNIDPSKYIGVAGDEISILKNYSGKIRNQVMEMFFDTPYKLGLSATPAPNDFMELGNHSEFLNVMTRQEMLAEFFIHDSKDTAKWRLKKHSPEKYWEWMSSWCIMFQHPRDIGFDQPGFDLPELKWHEHKIESGIIKPGSLFSEEARGMMDRKRARKETIKKRCMAAAKMINESDDVHLVWCGLNDESSLLSDLIKDSVEVTGSNSDKHKTESMLDFQNGKIKCLVTKPKIAGFGMNFQHWCHDTSFVGLSDSYEELYQAVRRVWRFGQKYTTNAHIFIADIEGAVLNNVRRKEKQAEEMHRQIIKNMTPFQERKKQSEYDPQLEMVLPHFLMEN